MTEVVPWPYGTVKQNLNSKKIVIGLGGREFCSQVALELRFIRKGHLKLGPEESRLGHIQWMDKTVKYWGTMGSLGMTSYVAKKHCRLF